MIGVEGLLKWITFYGFLWTPWFMFYKIIFISAPLELTS